jgi:hypothetical protein
MYNIHTSSFALLVGLLTFAAVQHPAVDKGTYDREIISKLLELIFTFLIN